jgi:hypothetical protein
LPLPRSVRSFANPNHGLDLYFYGFHRRSTKIQQQRCYSSCGRHTYKICPFYSLITSIYCKLSGPTFHRPHLQITWTTSSNGNRQRSNFYQSTMAAHLQGHENFITLYICLPPQSDGQTERVKQCLKNYLRYMVFLEPKKWLYWLPLAEWWYNSNYHTSLKCTPFEALYGYPPPLISEVMISGPESPAVEFLQQK